MSIRAKITLLVLLVGLSEAILLGIIGYNSVATVSRNAAEIRRISSAIEGARTLNGALSRFTDPGDALLGNDADAAARFRDNMDDLDRQFATCAASACHGYEKRPPQMAKQVREELKTLRGNGLRILASIKPGDPPPLAEWMAEVDGPARRVTRTTEEMSDTLLTKSKEIENSSREAEKNAGLLVASTTLFCVFMAVALCHPIARSVTRPLETFARQTRRIAEGDFGSRVGESGPREIAHLSGSFNRMLDDLERNRASLLAHQNHLEQTVEQRVAELRRKDDELKRSGRLASVGLIAGTVAHSLNNPLTSVLLNAEVLLESVDGDPKRQKIVEDIMRDVRRCRLIAAEIRAMSREMTVERIPCNLDKLVREAIHLVRFKSEPRRVAVTCDPGPGETTCRCSPPQMLQLLVNLVDNAVDASPDGASVEVRLRSEPSGAVVEVADHGSGIPDDRQESLFKPLFTTKAEGTGLGLAIARRIVEQHEGSIDYETRTGTDAHGTVFRVRLPEGRAGKVENHELGTVDPGH